MLKSMSVQEQTLYKKWQEFNKDEKIRIKFRQNHHKAELMYNRIWRPTNITNKELGARDIPRYLGKHILRNGFYHPKKIYSIFYQDRIGGRCCPIPRRYGWMHLLP